MRVRSSNRFSWATHAGAREQHTHLEQVVAVRVLVEEWRARAGEGVGERAA